MNYYEIIRAIRNYTLYAYSLGGMSTTDRVMTSVETAGFEQIINDYMAASLQLRKVKNGNKKACACYDAMGFNTYQIADKLHLNQSTIFRNLRWLKNFFAKECIKSEG